MIASKTVPDMISVQGIVKGEQYVENGLIIQLNDLLDKYGPEIMKNKKDVIYQGLNSGGKIWGVPGPGWYPNNFAFRTDWLKNLGMELPTDLDSLYKVLVAYTKNDPDKDGKDDTIGIGTTLKHQVVWASIFAAFGVPYERPIYQNGIVTSHIMHENYLDAIRYYRRLYREGLMEPDFATIPIMPCFEKLWNGIYGAFDFTAVGTTNNWLGRYTEDPKPTFDFAIIKGPDGQGGCLQMYSSSYWAITANCKRPDKAVEMANYFTSAEGEEFLYFGMEGTFFRWIDKSKGKFEYIPPYDDSATQRNAGGWVYNGLFKRSGINAEVYTLTPLTQKALKMGFDNPIEDAYIFRAPQIAKELGTTLSDIEKECIASLIVSEGDIEAEYEGFKKRWLAEGGETWQKQATEIYKMEHNM